jgi:hypothetical protein
MATPSPEDQIMASSGMIFDMTKFNKAVRSRLKRVNDGGGQMVCIQMICATSVVRAI